MSFMVNPRFCVVMVFSVFLVTLSGCSPADDKQENATKPAASVKAEDYKQSAPCLKIIDVCKAAGFFVDGYKEQKGLWADCFSVLMAGKPMANVMVNVRDLEACKANKTRESKS